MAAQKICRGEVALALEPMGPGLDSQLRVKVPGVKRLSFKTCLVHKPSLV